MPRRNVEFYAGVLGLRMVKKTVNQDDPTVYHLFYADEAGSPGADLTFFEYPGVGRGLPGAGMVHRIAWRVGSAAALEFWEERLRGAGSDPVRTDAALRFADPEGLEHELVVYDGPDAPLLADAPDVPAEHALQGFDGVRAYTLDPARSTELLRDVLGFRDLGDGRWEVRGEQRGGLYTYDLAPPIKPVPGAGSVHHIAFASRREEQAAWQEHVAGSRLARPDAGDRPLLLRVDLLPRAEPRPVRDRDDGPRLRHRRGRRRTSASACRCRRDSSRCASQLEQTLTPLPDPRARRAAAEG